MTIRDHDLYRLLDWLCVLEPGLRQPLLAEAARWQTALTPEPTAPPAAADMESGALRALLQTLLEQAAAQDRLAEGVAQVAVRPRLEPCARCGQTGLGHDNIVVDGDIRYQAHSFDCPHCGWIAPPPPRRPDAGDQTDPLAVFDDGRG